jgi:hypothetical protein
VFENQLHILYPNSKKITSLLFSPRNEVVFYAHIKFMTIEKALLLCARHRSISWLIFFLFLGGQAFGFVLFSPSCSNSIPLALSYRPVLKNKNVNPVDIF